MAKKAKRWDAIIERIPKAANIIGAEIGVLTGKTSYQILKARPRVTHIMIDSWEVPKPGTSYAKEADENAQKPQAAHDAAFLRTKKLTAFAGKRAVIRRGYSLDIVKTIADGSLDYVFVDGDHSYEGCKADIIAWTPKVKKGGWIGGHDYDHPKLPGVKKAVDEMFDSVKLDVNRTWFRRIV